MPDDDEILGANDPEAYAEAVELVTADGDREVFVVETNQGGGWSVAAVFTSYADVEAYIEDYRDFTEHCPEDAPEDHCRNTIRFRHGSRQSPTPLYESWPPEVGDDA
jgi:hypothetical protein